MGTGFGKGRFRAWAIQEIKAEAVTLVLTGLQKKQCHSVMFYWLESLELVQTQEWVIVNSPSCAGMSDQPPVTGRMESTKGSVKKYDASLIFVSLYMVCILSESFYSILCVFSVLGFHSIMLKHAFVLISLATHSMSHFNLKFFYLYLIMENQIFPTLYFFTPSGTLLSSFYHFYFNSPYFPYIIACYLLRKFFHLIFHFYNQSFIHVHVGTYTIH